MIRWTEFETPFGSTFLAATARGLLRVNWGVEDAEAAAEELTSDFPLWGVRNDPEELERVMDEILEYFAGDRRSFDVSVDLTGLTSFQQSVLEATAQIPFGETMTYGRIAALGRNPVPIVIPCHRVVRSDGSLGGYTAGTGYKEQLLELEARG